MSVFLEVGDRIPLGKDHLYHFPTTLKESELVVENLKGLEIDEVFGDKNVLLIGVQGAFMSNKEVKNILKRFNRTNNHSLVIITINDPWVTRSWSDSLILPKDCLICSDIDGRFTEMIGMISEFPFLGRRSKNYSMLVKKSIVKSINEGEERWVVWDSLL